MAIRCIECFDELLAAPLLAERCASVTISYVHQQKALAIFKCCHGQTRRHSIYSDTQDWAWAQTICKDAVAA